MRRLFVPVLLGVVAVAQTRQIPSPEEQQDLMKAVSEGQNSSVDMLRALETFLAKHPDSAQKIEIYRTLARAAIDVNDAAKTVKYGVPALESAGGDSSTDPLLLDRVSRALLSLGGTDNLKEAIKLSRTYEDLISGMDPASGKDAARRQDERERAVGRALSNQATARRLLGQMEDATRTAARAFAAYPSEETARGWADALTAEKRNEEAIAKLADAFSIPDQYAPPAQRQLDRQRLGEMYAALHGGSQKGLGSTPTRLRSRLLKPRFPRSTARS